MSTEEKERIDFKKVLAGGSVSLHLESDAKEGIIEEMIDLMVKDGKVQDREDAVRAVMEREQKMSTGMQHGVAVPHGKTLTVDYLVTAFALKKEGMDFAALDGEPSRIFVMTISSPLRTGPHVQYLSEIGRLLSCPAVRDKMLEANSREEIISLLSE